MIKRRVTVRNTGRASSYSVRHYWLRPLLAVCPVSEVFPNLVRKINRYVVLKLTATTMTVVLITFTGADGWISLSESWSFSIPGSE